MYKGLVRLGGAICGTVLALLIATVHFPNGFTFATVAFAVVFAAMWLRERNYAYWAAGVTVLFALLQGQQGEPSLSLFVTRLAAIVVGALCGIAATYFVFPIRTEHIVRRRIADALIAMSSVLSGEIPEAERLSRLEHHTSELERIAPPVRLHRAVFGRTDRAHHPATWIDSTHALLQLLRTPPFDRRHISEELHRIRAILRDAQAAEATTRRA
jgi:uncharacterized membrane protein YgaE (UPF0421/DUF939 family)